jgi:SagB-type dehydrogenase family enzyme
MKTDYKFLKSDRWEEWKVIETDQKKSMPAPPIQKPYGKEEVLIDLVASEDFKLGKIAMIEAINNRRSRRKFSGAALTLEELSLLLWATQGISELVKQDNGKNVPSLRTVPSGGARHPFETYLLVNAVEGITPGLYRYLPLEHKLCFIKANLNLIEQVHEASYQQYIKKSSVVFIWTVIPYRTEWRYSMMAPKIIAQDSGHMCQNLYLACESIGAGTCAIGAYDQRKIDSVLGVDGEEEFTIYLAPVGKI